MAGLELYFKRNIGGVKTIRVITSLLVCQGAD